MRLSCPNCEAQYEVSEEVIPENGRDVQCSNCGQTWFVDKYPHRHDDVEDEELPVVAAPKPRAAPRSYPPAEAKAAQPAPARKPRRSPVTEDVQAVLKQEAAREIAARQAEANAGLEVQDEFALDPPQATPTAAAPISRRSQLPDIEEINSSLAATTSKAIPAPEPEPEDPIHKKNRRRKGSRLGFVFAILVLAALVALYVFAPDVTQAFPQFTDQVNTYVIFVNDLRQWVLEAAEVFVIKVQELAGTTPPTQ